MQSDGGGPSNPSRRVLLGSGLIALSAMVAFCSTSAGRIKKHRLKIAGGPAAVALRELILQTRLQVLFDFDAVRPFVTRDVEGELDADEALRVMLYGTGLTYEFINDRTVAVRPAAATLGR